MKNKIVRLFIMMFSFMLFGLVVCSSNVVFAKEENYMVDFAYDNKTTSIKGNSLNVNLVNTLEKIGIEETIDEIELYYDNEKILNNEVKKDNVSLFKVYEIDNDWYFDSYNSFEEEYEMLVKTINSEYFVLISDPAPNKGYQEPPSGLSVSSEIYQISKGQISGVTDEMEYKLSTGNEYIAIESGKTTIEELDAGTYCIRYKETNSYFASDCSNVTILLKYRITYSINTDDSSVVGSVNYTEDVVGGSEITIQSFEISRDNYSVLGFDTNKDASTATYSSGDSYTVNGSNVTFYVIWDITPVNCNDISYNKILDSSFTGGEMTSGNYYLTSNLVIEENILVLGLETVRICLNGYVITQNNLTSSLFTVRRASFLYIDDCNTTSTHNFEINDHLAVYNEETTSENKVVVTGGAITGLQNSIVNFEYTAYPGITYFSFNNITIIGNTIGANALFNFDPIHEEIQTLNLSNVKIIYNKEDNELESSPIIFGNENAQMELTADYLEITNNYFKASKILGLIRLNAETYNNNYSKFNINHVTYNNNTIIGSEEVSGAFIWNAGASSSNTNYLKNSTFTNSDIKSNKLIKALIYTEFNSTAYELDSDTFSYLNFEILSETEGAIQGGVLNTGHHITLKNSTISHCTFKAHNSDHFDGKPTSVIAYLNAYGSLTINNTSVTDNIINYNHTNLVLGNSSRGAYIYAESNVPISIDTLTFTNNDINFTNSIDSTTSFDGIYIYSYNDVTISNSKFENNDFKYVAADEEKGYTTINGGFIYSGSTSSTPLTITNTDFISNSVDVNSGRIYGGLIYSWYGITFSGNEDDYSRMNSNKIKANFDYDQYYVFGVYGGLIYASNTAVITKVEMLENEIYCNLRIEGALLRVDSSISPQVSNSLINSNKVEGTTINGLLRGQFIINNTDFESNIFNLQNFSGQSETNTINGLMFFMNHTSGENRVVTFNQVNITLTKINVKSSGYIFCGLIYGVAVDINVTDSVIEKTTVDTTLAKFKEIKGFIFNSESYTSINLDNVIIKENATGDCEGIIMGAIIYGGGIEKNVKLKDTNIKDNTINCDTIEGLIYVNQLVLINVEISDNEITVTNRIRGKIIYLPMSKWVKLGGEIIITNNTSSIEDADIYNCADDAIGYLQEDSDTPITSLNTLKIRFSSEEITDEEIIFKDGANYINSEYIELYDDRFFIKVKDNDLIIKHRVIANPTTSNEITYLLDSTDTTLTYKWYIVSKNNGNLFIDQTTNKLDTTHLLIGTYYCVATTSDGNIFTSNTITLIPSSLENPSYENGYKYLIDEDKYNNESIDITYSWYLKEGGENATLNVVDDTEASSTNVDVGMPISDITYDSSKEKWIFDENGLGAIKIYLNANERVLLTITLTETDALISEGFYYILKDYEYGDDAEEKMCGMFIFSGTEESFVITPSESGNYTIVGGLVNDDEEIIPNEMGIYKYESTTNHVYFDEENIIANDAVVNFEDTYNTGSAYDSETHIISKSATEGVDFTSFVLYLEKDEIVLFEDFVNKEDIAEISVLLYYASTKDGEMEISSMISDSLLRSYKARETGYYRFVLIIYDEDYNPIEWSGKVYSVSCASYTLVEDQTESELSANAENGKYIARATFTNQNSIITIQSASVEFTRYTLNYSANGKSGAIAPNNGKYKTNTVTIGGVLSDLEECGFTFLEWNSEADGSGTSYDIGDELTFTTSSVTLYAIFENKTTVNITETVQTYTYGDNDIRFKITGNVTTGFTISYYVNSEWTTSVPTNAGTYNVKLTRSDDDHYYEYEKTITNGLTINKLKVDEPLVIGTYTYSGLEQTIELSGVENYMQTKNSLKQTNAGVYYIVYTLDSNHEWNNGSDGYIIWVISKMKVNEPFVSKTYTYNGEEQTLELNGVTSYMTTKDSFVQSESGEYTIKYTLDSNHEWNNCDGEVTWVINKVKVNEPLVTGTYTYTGVSQKVNLTGVESYMRTEDVLRQINVGTYTITYTLDNNHEWNINNDGIVTWSITKAKVSEPIVIGTYTYTGISQKVSLSGVESYMTTNDSLRQTNVGTYTINYILDNNHEWDDCDGVITWSITKAKVKEPSVVGTYVYSGYEQIVNLTGVESYMTTEDTLTKTNVGTYTIHYTLDSNHEWDDCDGVITWSITKAKVSEPKVLGNYTYTGSQQKVALSGIKSYMSTSDSLNQTNVGTYTITYTLDSNHEWDNCDGIITWNITKAKVDEPRVIGNYVYTGETIIVRLAGVKDYMTTIDSLSQTNIGTYTIHYTLDSNHEWDNCDGIVTWEIKKASINDSEENTQAIIEANDGFSENVSVEVEVIEEKDVSSSIKTDYKLKSSEKVGVVFDIKLVQIINNEKNEVTLSDLDEDEITIKMLLPQNVDTSKVNKILYVTDDGEIKSIEFDLSNIDENGYYELTIDSVNEIAFIYEKEGLSVWLIILIVLLSLILIYIGLFFIWKREYDNTKEDKMNERKLKFLDKVNKPINKMIFKDKK